MKIVLDANILISAIEFGGKPDAIVKLVISRKITGYISEEIIKETIQILGMKFGYPPKRLSEILKFLRTDFTVVALGYIPTFSRDPNDDHILAITHEQKIDFIISGDKDLLTLKTYRGVPIVSVADFHRQLES